MPVTVMPVTVVAVMFTVPVVPMIAAVICAVTPIRHPITGAVLPIRSTISTVIEPALKPILAIPNVRTFPIAETGAISNARTIPGTRSTSQPGESTRSGAIADPWAIAQTGASCRQLSGSRARSRPRRPPRARSWSRRRARTGLWPD